MKQKDGELPWAEVGDRVQTPWRTELHRDFERALSETKLPERPDCDLPRRSKAKAGVANRSLIKARRKRPLDE
jgi:hypothetical protein